MSKTEISAVILAGGRGTRMGGADKGLQLLADRPMIAHVIERMAPQVQTLIISANRNLNTYAQFGLPVISDRIAGYCGPLAGLHSALSSISTDWLISAPCDTPYIPMDYVARMCAAVKKSFACVAHDGERLQAGFCLLHRDILPLLTQTLEARHFAVHRFLNEAGAVQADFSDQADAFHNINTRAELLQAQQA